MEDDNLPATQPVDTRILKDVVAFVDVRTGHNNQSTAVAAVLELLGATVSAKFNKSVTHVIFKDGGQGTYKKAKRLGLHLLSVLWVESCRQNETKVTEHLYPAQVSADYDGPVRIRKMKSMQPVDLEEDLARSGKLIKRRERAEFRRELRRRCFGPRADGSDPLSIKCRSPYVYEGNSIPNVVLKPHEFDNYKSSSDESCEERVLPLVQRLLLRFPDSPEIKEYVENKGRFRKIKGMYGSPEHLSAFAGEIRNNVSPLQEQHQNKELTSTGAPKVQSDCGVTHNSTAKDCSSAEVVEKGTRGMLNMTPKRLGKSRKCKQRANVSATQTNSDSTSGPLVLVKHGQDNSTAEITCSSLQDSNTAVAVASLICKGTPAGQPSKRRKDTRSVEPFKTNDQNSLPAASAVSNKLISDIGNMTLSSRNSLDEFKPVFSRRTRRKLVLDKCVSPGVPRARRKSISTMSALPNMTTKHIVLTSFEICDKETIIPIMNQLGGFRLSCSVDRYTTHLLTGANRRTINSLMATVRGCWILSGEWVFKSLEAGTWLDEEPYELSDAFPAAKVFRLERSKIEDGTFVCNLFTDVGPVSLSSNTSVPDLQLKELLKLAGAEVVKDYQNAKINVGPPPLSCDAICISELWVLDCITNHCILPFEDYLVRKESAKRKRSHKLPDAFD